MFKVMVNNAVLMENDYENADFSRIVRKIANLELNILDVWLAFDYIENDDGFTIKLADIYEVKNTIMAFLDEIDMQLDAIQWLKEEMSWNSRFCQKLDRKEKNLRAFDTIVFEFLEINLKALKKD